MTTSASTSSTTEIVSMNARRRSGKRGPTSASIPRPTTKKKNVISPLLTQYPSSLVIPWDPMRIDSSVLHTDLYDDASTLTQTRAATVAASSTAALPVSVVRKLRSGVGMLRVHAVLPEKGVACASAMASARRAEALGADPSGVVPERDERVRGRLDERRRPADVGQRLLVGRPRDLAEQLGVDAARIARPVLRPLAREREAHVDAVARAQPLELVAIDHLAQRARRVQQPRRRVA